VTSSRKRLAARSVDRDVLPAEDGTRRRPRTGRLAIAAGLFYLASRLCVILGAAAVATQQATVESGRVGDRGQAVFSPGGMSLLRRMLGVLTSWDSQWYLTITRYGYPAHIPADVNGSMLESRAAFFPVYPYLVRLVDAILPGGSATAAVITNLVTGFVAVYLVGVLALRLYDEEVARLSMLLFAVFPGSLILSFGYAEALFICGAAGALILVHDERWIAAGSVAAVASMTRPTGLAIGVAFVVAAAVSWRHRRSWRPVVGSLLALSGYAAALALIGFRAGEYGAWFRVQRDAWDEGLSFGWSTFRASWDAIVNPFESPRSLLTLLTIVVLVVLVVASVSARLPLPLMVYSLAIAALMLVPLTVSARPRFLLAAFPLFIGTGAWITRRKRSGTAWNPELDLLFVGVCCAGLTALTALYGSGAAVP
jgi:hypothetical protein